MENKLVKLLSRYPYEYKSYQEGWGMDEGLYEALCEHYFEEGHIPHGVWTGPLEELRSYVEEKYCSDTQELMENPALAALLPAVLRVAVANPVTTAKVVGTVANAVSNAIHGSDEYEEEDDTSVFETSEDTKVPAVMRKNKDAASPQKATPSWVRDPSDLKSKIPAMQRKYNRRLDPATETSELESSLRQSVQETENNMSNSMEESKFTKLASKLSHKKGVKDPKALAAWIGREKLGQKEMTKRSVAARKDESVEVSEGDIQMENWEKELHSLLNEGLTVTTSTGQPGGSDSVSVSATDSDAHTLMKLLQSAGITSGGLSGGSDSADVTVTPVSSDEVLTQLGTDKEQSQDSGDSDLSFLKKMLGQREKADHVDETNELEERVTYGPGGQVQGGWQAPANAPASAPPAGSGMKPPATGAPSSGINPATSSGTGMKPPVSSPYSLVPETDEVEEMDIKPGMTVDQAKATKSYATNPAARAEVDKANAFASAFDKKVPPAPAAKTQQTTNEEDMEEGNAYVGARKDAIKAGKDTFTVGGKTHKVTGDTDDEKKMNEEEELNESRCDECGMYESKCSCDHEKLEEWANSSDEDKQFATEMEFMTRILSGGLNNIKRDQTVLPSTKVKVAEGKKSGPNFTNLLKKLQSLN
jgi:hypothetical protein